MKGRLTSGCSGQVSTLAADPSVSPTEENVYLSAKCFTNRMN